MDPEHVDYGLENYGQGYYAGPPPGEALIIAEDGRISMPLLVTGYSAQRQGRSIVHDTLDNAIAVVLGPARPRSGSLMLLYAAEAEAHVSQDLHSSGQLLWLAVGARPRLDMRYAVTGTVELVLDEQTRDHWLLTIPYQEVS